MVQWWRNPLNIKIPCFYIKLYFYMYYFFFILAVNLCNFHSWQIWQRKLIFEMNISIIQTLIQYIIWAIPLTWHVNVHSQLSKEQFTSKFSCLIIILQKSHRTLSWANLLLGFGKALTFVQRLFLVTLLIILFVIKNKRRNSLFVVTTKLYQTDHLST